MGDSANGGKHRVDIAAVESYDEACRRAAAQGLDVVMDLLRLEGFPCHLDSTVGFRRA